MRPVEELLHDLAASMQADRGRTGGFDVDRLRAGAARRRRTRRQLLSAGVAGIAVLAMAAGLAATARDGRARVESVDRPPAQTSTTAGPGSSGPADQGAGSGGAAGPGDGEQGDAEAGYAIDPEDAAEAMVVVEAFLAALAVEDWDRAAELWEPAPDLVPDAPAEADRITWLRRLCSDAGGCGDGVELLGARGDGRGRAEVFLHRPSPFTLWAAPTPPRGEADADARDVDAGEEVEAAEDGAAPSTWRVVSSFVPRGDVLFDVLFPGGTPSPVSLHRDGRLDVPTDAGPSTAVGALLGDGVVVNPWVRRGWLHTEGAWVSLDDPGQRCDYAVAPADDGPGYVAVDLAMIDGRWVAEIVGRSGEGAPTERSVFFDCERGEIDPGLDDLGSGYYDHGNVDRRLFSPSGASVRHLADGNGAQMGNHRILTADGTAIPVLAPGNVDASGGLPNVVDIRYVAAADSPLGIDTVAYLWTEGADIADSWQLVVRSLGTGEEMVAIDVPGGGAVGYDGRYLTFSVSGDGAVGPMDGTIHTPGGLLIVHDLVTGDRMQRRVQGTLVFLG